MKLYWIVFRDEFGRADEVAVLDENREMSPQLSKWSTINLGFEIDPEDIKDVYAFSNPHDSEGRKYRVTTELIAPENCDHADHGISLDGQKCLDCGLEVAA